MSINQRILLSHIASWILIVLVLASSLCYTYMANQADPYIKEYYTHPVLLHKPPTFLDKSSEPVFDSKIIIRPGANVYVYREYHMIGDFNNGAHYTWIEHIETGFVYKYPVTSIIGIYGKRLKMPFYYRLPDHMPMGKYKLVTRLYGSTNAFNKYQQDLEPVYFEVK